MNKRRRSYTFNPERNINFHCTKHGYDREHFVQSLMIRYPKFRLVPLTVEFRTHSEPYIWKIIKKRKNILQGYMAEYARDQRFDYLFTFPPNALEIERRRVHTPVGMA